MRWAAWAVGVVGFLASAVSAARLYELLSEESATGIARYIIDSYNRFISDAFYFVFQWQFDLSVPTWLQHSMIIYSFFSLCHLRFFKLYRHTSFITSPKPNEGVFVYPRNAHKWIGFALGPLSLLLWIYNSIESMHYDYRRFRDYESVTFLNLFLSNLSSLLIFLIFIGLVILNAGLGVVIVMLSSV